MTPSTRVGTFALEMQRRYSFSSPGNHFDIPASPYCRLVLARGDSRHLAKIFKEHKEQRWLFWWRIGTKMSLRAPVEAETREIVSSAGGKHGISLPDAR